MCLLNETPASTHEASQQTPLCCAIHNSSERSRALSASILKKQKSIMSGHHHNSNAGTQNQGNSLGDRACVRQSKLYRTHESGNDVKSILGTDHLRWDTEHQEGAYKGQKVFDHNKPNSVTNELRARSSDMKQEINSNYVNDWTTESGSYKNSTGKTLGGKAPATMRDSYRNPVNDENMLVRSSKYGQNDNGYGTKDYGYAANPSDYEYGNSSKNSARNANRAGGSNASSMGGMSLSQFQSESAAYVQAPPQASKYGRGSGNSEGFSAAMNQPDRSYSNTSGQDYEYRNNIYGGEETNSRTSARQQPAPTSYGGKPANPNNTYAAPAPYKSAAMIKQAQSYSQAPYAQDGDGDAGRTSQRGTGRDSRDSRDPRDSGRDAYARDSYARDGRDAPRGYAPEPQYGNGNYDDDDYQVPGIAAEGAGNREGRSTRPW